MKKIKEFFRRPITWGDYGKMCIFSIVMSIVYVFYLFGWFGELKDKIVNLFGKKNDETEEE